MRGEVGDMVGLNGGGMYGARVAPDSNASGEFGPMRMRSIYQAMPRVWGPGARETQHIEQPCNPSWNVC